MTQEEYDKASTWDRFLGIHFETLEAVALIQIRNYGVVPADVVKRIYEELKIIEERILNHKQ